MVIMPLKTKRSYYISVRQHTEVCPKEIPGKILLCARRQQYQATSGSLLMPCMFASIIITHLR